MRIKCMRRLSTVLAAQKHLNIQPKYLCIYYSYTSIAWIGVGGVGTSGRITAI